MAAPTIANPNYLPLDLIESELPDAARQALRQALILALAAWPCEQSHVSLHDLVVAVRATTAGRLDPASFDGHTLADLLGDMGFRVS